MMFNSILSFLYVNALKPIVFQLDAEKVHDSFTDMGEWLGSYTFTRNLTEMLLQYRHISLERTLCGIHFPNPVGLSAGFDYEAKLTNILPSVGFGFATIGTVTLEPYQGNQPPRLGRFPKSRALLVNKGFKTIGAKAIIRKLENRTFEIPIGISIGNTNTVFSSLAARIEDITQTFQLFDESGVLHSYYELNISCPNTAEDQPFSHPKNLQTLLQSLQKLHVSRPVFLKMPIDFSEKETLALLRTADKSFVAGVIFGNLTKDKNNPDVHPDDKILWQQRHGNLSGKPTWNRSNHWIKFTRHHFHKRFVIIGTGGIFSGEDATIKLKLGADLVQLITGMVYNGPQMIGEINRYLAHL